MINIMFRDLFTGLDGVTYHMAKFSWVFSMVSYTAVVLYHLAHTPSIDFMSLAGGYGVICTTHSAAIWGMKSQEPSCVKESTTSVKEDPV